MFIIVCFMYGLVGLDWFFKGYVNVRVVIVIIINILDMILGIIIVMVF